MEKNQLSKIPQYVFLSSGAYILLCIPGIYLAEARGWSQVPFHTSQFIATILCLLSSVLFLITEGRDRKRGAKSKPKHVALAWVALVATSAFVGLTLYVVFTWDTTGME